MTSWIISFLCLFIGCKLFERKTEQNFGADIHRHKVVRRDIQYDPLPSRQLQLAQLGLIFGAESFLGIIIGLLYGPLMMAWCVIGTTFWGAALNYYCGMFALSEGKTINTLLLKIFNKRVFLLLSGVLVLFICLAICSNFVFLFNLNHDMLGHSLWLLVVILVIVVSLLSPRLFIKFCAIAGGLILFSSAWFLIFSLTRLNEMPAEFDPWSFTEMKFVYPLLFFSVTSGALSGISALKTSLTAPYVKNEKVGKMIFWRTAFIQSGLVILWDMLILSWNPTREFIVSIVVNGGNFYNVLAENFTYNIFLGRYLLFITMAVIGVVSIVSLLRVGTDIVLETAEYPPLLLFGVESCFLLFCAFIYPITLNLNFSTLNLLVISIYVLLLVSAYLKKKGIEGSRYFLMALFLSGVLNASFVLYACHETLQYSIMAGILFSLILYILLDYKEVSRMYRRFRYWYKRRQIYRRRKQKNRINMPKKSTKQIQQKQPLLLTSDNAESTIEAVSSDLPKQNTVTGKLQSENPVEKTEQTNPPVKKKRKPRRKKVQTEKDKD